MKNYKLTTPLPLLQDRPREYLFMLSAVMAINSFFWNTLTWFIYTVHVMSSIYYWYGLGILILGFCGVAFWFSSVRIISVILIIITTSIILAFCLAAYVFTYAATNENQTLANCSLILCLFVSLLSLFTLYSSRLNLLKIYLSLNNLISLGFINTTTNDLIWNHALTTHPYSGPFPESVTKYSYKNASDVLFSPYVIIGVYGNLFSSIALAVFSRETVLAFSTFVLCLFMMVLGHVFWKFVLLLRIAVLYKMRYGKELVIIN